MPVQYAGILDEHAATRHGVSIFDISHMGEFIIQGDCVKSGLDGIVTMSLQDLPVRACRYGCMLNPQGGIIDDLIVFRLEEEKWFIVVNGATTAKDAAHFQKHLTGSADFKDVSAQTGKIDVQGPLSRDVMRSFVADIEKLNYYTFDFFDLLGEHVLISRTGYTGELGYEIYFPWDRTPELWQALMAHEGVKPAGLGARDVLRIEMGYSLYGHELEENISPLEAGLNRFVHLDKEFFGKAALLEQQESGVQRKIVGIRSNSRRSPRQGHLIFTESGESVGEVTSGTFSPSLRQGIGLGFVSCEHAQTDSKILFGSVNNKNEAVISSRAFYKDGSLRR